MIINKELHRAKHVYSEKYVISNSIKWIGDMLYLLKGDLWIECEPETRSIHFNDMIDSENNPIFASLQEDGRGGSKTTKGVCIYNREHNQFRIIVDFNSKMWCEVKRNDIEDYNIKITGIQK